MASNVIDALVVTLGLDSKGFAQGIRGSTAELASFTRKMAGMFIAVRGIEDVVGYFKDLHAQLAEIGFTSKNLGVAGTELKKLGEVSELFGGQMQDAADSVNQLQSSVFNLRYKGQMSESLLMMQRFGVAYLTAAGHARNFRSVALDASKAIDKQAKATGMDKGERYQMALSMGFTGGVASAVAQGGKGLEDALKKAQVDQRALTEQTIEGQRRLAQQLTRLHESTAAQSSAILNKLMPAITKLTTWLQKLVDILLPKIVAAIDKVIKFFEHPPEWAKGIVDALKSLAEFLGPGGTLIAALGALALTMSAGGALVSAVAGLAGPIAAVIAMGTALGYLIDKIPGVNDAVQKGAASIFDIFDIGGGEAASHLGEGRQSVRGKIQRAPATPGVPRQPSAAAQSGASAASPAASTGASGTHVQIDSMTINTKATDADGIAGDINGALRRKVNIANADGGIG